MTDGGGTSASRRPGYDQRICGPWWSGLFIPLIWLFVSSRVRVLIARQVPHDRWSALRPRCIGLRPTVNPVMPDIL